MSIAKETANRISDRGVFRKGDDANIIRDTRGYSRAELIEKILSEFSSKVDHLQIRNIYSGRTVGSCDSGILKTGVEGHLQSYPLVIIEFIDGSCMGIGTSEFTKSSMERDMLNSEITRKLQDVHEAILVENFIKHCYTELQEYKD